MLISTWNVIILRDDCIAANQQLLSMTIDSVLHAIIAYKIPCQSINLIPPQPSCEKILSAQSLSELQRGEAGTPPISGRQYCLIAFGVCTGNRKDRLVKMLQVFC